MLTVDNLTFAYKKNTPPTLDKISFKLSPGEIGIFLGSNGSGKSTLFKALLGLVKADSGNVQFNNSDLLHMSNRKKAQLISYVPQNITFGELSVYDTIMLGRLSHFSLTPSREDYSCVNDIIEEMHLTRLLRQDVNSLSGGEKQKIAIAQALAGKPEILILDEPTSNLDYSNIELTMSEIFNISRSKNITVLCSFHDINQAMSIGDSYFFLKDGQLVYSGDEAIIDSELLLDVYGMNAKIADIDGRKLVIADYKLHTKGEY